MLPLTSNASLMITGPWTHLHHLAVVLHPRCLQSFNMMTSAVKVDEFAAPLGDTSLKRQSFTFPAASMCLVCLVKDKEFVTLRSGNCCRYASRFSSVESTSLLWKSSHSASQSCKNTTHVITATGPIAPLPVTVPDPSPRHLFVSSNLSNGHDIIFSVPVRFIHLMQRLGEVDGSLLHPCRARNKVSRLMMSQRTKS